MKKKIIAGLFTVCILAILGFGNLSKAANTSPVSEEEKKDFMSDFYAMNLVEGDNGKTYTTASEIPKDVVYVYTRCEYQIDDGATMSYANFSKDVNSLFDGNLDMRSYLTQHGEYNPATDSITFRYLGFGGDTSHLKYLYSETIGSNCYLYGAILDHDYTKPAGAVEGFDYVVENYIGNVYDSRVVGYVKMKINCGKGGKHGGVISSYEMIDKALVSLSNTQTGYYCTSDGIYQPIKVNGAKGVTYTSENIYNLPKQEGKWIRVGEQFTLNTTVADSSYEIDTVWASKGSPMTNKGNGAYSYTVSLGRGRIQSVDITFRLIAKNAKCIAAGKHNYGTYKVTKQSTALATGRKERICSVCGHTDTVSIAKLRPTAKINYKSLKLKVRQSTSAWKITRLAKEDYIKSYKSSNKKVATVSSKGKITGKKSGRATITATLASGKKVKVKVTVQKQTVKTTKLSLTKKNLTMKKGETCKLNVTRKPVTARDKITYTSSKKTVVTVSGNGKIKAKKKGKAIITIKAGKKKVTCKVIVK